MIWSLRYESWVHQYLPLGRRLAGYQGNYSEDDEKEKAEEDDVKIAEGKDHDIDAEEEDKIL